MDTVECHQCQLPKGVDISTIEPPSEQLKGNTPMDDSKDWNLRAHSCLGEKEVDQRLGVDDYKQLL